MGGYWLFICMVRRRTTSDSFVVIPSTALSNEKTRGKVKTTETNTLLGATTTLAGSHNNDHGGTTSFRTFVKAKRKKDARYIRFRVGGYLER